MQEDVKRLGSGKTVAGHSVEGDIKLIGLKKEDFAGIIDTKDLGQVKHSGKHDSLADAREHVKLAVNSLK